jgi:hypothetical protein
MPGFNGTGPRGMGPMTGGGRGFCSPWGIGRAYGMGRSGAFRGPGGGFRAGFARRGMGAYGGYTPPWGAYAPPTYETSFPKASDLSGLKEQARMMEEELNEIQQRIRDLGS